MQSQRIAVERPSVKGSWTGRVLGLGVTDVPRVELEPEQVPSLVEQLGVMRRVYEDAVVKDRARLQEIPELAGEGRHQEAVEAEKDLDASEFDLAALDVIRAQLVRGGDAELAIHGPSRIVAELVRESTRRVAAALNELLATRPRSDAEARARLVDVAAAAKAWTETYVECEAVEWFKVEVNAAPPGAYPGPDSGS